jgi:peptidoglycan/LPS O-acetylase OafA/YrhL
METGVSQTMIQRGYLGVDMFFVLSGFLIVTLLLREQDRTHTISIGRFYARRALRIFPPYYLLLFLLAILYTFVSKGTPLSKAFFEALPYNLTYTSNWIVMDGMIRIFWSLATEEQFYLVWPFVQKYCGRKMIFGLLAFIIGVSQLMNYRLIDADFRQVFGVGYLDLNILQVTFTPIALGALLANLMHRQEGYRLVYILTGYTGASVIWFVLLIATMNIPAADIGGTLRLTIQLVMTVFLASCVVREDHLLRPLLTLWPIRKLGVISYGVYLYHTLGHHFGLILSRKIGLELPAVVFANTLAISVGFAYLSFVYWEKWFLNLKDRLALSSAPAVEIFGTRTTFGDRLGIPESLESVGLSTETPENKSET